MCFTYAVQTICEVGELFVEEDEAITVGSGNNIRVKLKGIEETDVVCRRTLRMRKTVYAYLYTKMTHLILIMAG